MSDHDPLRHDVTIHARVTYPVIIECRLTDDEIENIERVADLDWFCDQHNVTIDEGSPKDIGRLEW